MGSTTVAPPLRGMARRTSLGIAALALALFLGACAAVPQAIHREVVLVAVERSGEADGEVSDISVVETPDGKSYEFSDGMLGFRVGYHQNFVNLHLDNPTTEPLYVLWDESALIDTERFAHDVTILKGLPVSGARGDRRTLVPPGAKREMRLAPEGSATPLGFTRPLIPIDRHGRASALQQAEELLGATVDLRLQLQHQDMGRTYTLTGELQRVNVGGTWVE